MTSEIKSGELPVDSKLIDVMYYRWSLCRLTFPGHLLQQQQHVS